jgi:hypothetical protein
MAQPNLRELAKQGNPKAIAIMLERSLQPHSITAQVGRKEDCLQILLESAQIPEEQKMVPFIRNGLIKLGVESVTTVKVYARQTGEQSPAWQQTFELVAPEETSSSQIFEPVIPEETSSSIEPTDSQNSPPGATFYKVSRSVSPRAEMPSNPEPTEVENQPSSPANFEQRTSRQSIRPLSVGNVVSAGLRLYRDHFKLYLGLAFIALLWSFIPIYGWAKSYQIQALISRQAFSELVNQPESVKTIQTQLDSRLWEFWIAQFLIGLISFGVYMGLWMSSAILLGIPTIILTAAFKNSLGITVIVILLQIIVRLGSLAVYIWVYSHFFIAELPLAIENNIGAVDCISRSWELTKGFVVRIQLIILVAALIALPLMSIGMTPILLAIPFFSTPPSSPEAIAIAIFEVFGLMMLLIALGNTLIVPFWQAIKAVIYYDLRSRREGLGLQIRDSLV